MRTCIRPEETKDIQAIRDTIQAAFAAKSHLAHQESRIVDKLRESGDLTLSLAADGEDAIVGHVAVSPVRIEGQDHHIQGWYGLGPMAVHPGWQRQGIGTALVEQALKTLRDQAASGCVVLGRPELYTRFGFSRDHSLRVEGVPKRFTMVLPMKESMPIGIVKYHEAFNV
ncbi:hypothetical protein M409DRAFT_16321 [Zasmidium cellare ATCC 36951]|uniref:N-acetyltransferase domain-containing protein n=1 Tax=Zasmidium cellare ATCC 36951 TaxID=1080233 RepID=A0A6A6D8S1_ZASCE|nr:uncharacterized protein M409DRAFT_16321 [Zasmidium cellare ATCC 36951]KAF2174046.1 hypothetical protein M409DRAFT_16321 [Zasmidium cellare ATCC 36951]